MGCTCASVGVWDCPIHNDFKAIEAKMLTAIDKAIEANMLTAIDEEIELAFDREVGTVRCLCPREDFAKGFVARTCPLHGEMQYRAYPNWPPGQTPTGRDDELKRLRLAYDAGTISANEMRTIFKAQGFDGLGRIDGLDKPVRPLTGDIDPPKFSPIQQAAARERKKVADRVMIREPQGRAKPSTEDAP